MANLTRNPMLLLLAGALSFAGPASALGPDSYLGSVGLTGGYCPKGTIEANGMMMEISKNMNLYTVLGSKYGGDGRTTFALPKLTDKVPLTGMKYCVVVTGKLPPRN